MLRRLTSTFSQTQTASSPQRVRVAGGIISSPALVSPQRQQHITNNTNINNYNLQQQQCQSQPHFTSTNAEFISPRVPRATSSMCFTGSMLVLPARGAHSPTTEAKHAALSPPFLRALTKPAAASGSVKALAHRQLEDVVQRAWEELGEEGEELMRREHEEALALEQQQQRNAPFLQRLMAEAGGGVGGGRGSTTTTTTTATRSSESKRISSASSSLTSQLRRPLASVASAARVRRAAGEKKLERMVLGAGRKKKKQMQQHQQQQKQLGTSGGAARSSAPRPATSSAAGARRGVVGGRFSFLQQHAKPISSKRQQHSATTDHQQQQQQSSNQIVDKKKNKTKNNNTSSSSVSDAAANETSANPKAAFSEILWRDWDASIFEQADRENKLLLIRIVDSRSKQQHQNQQQNNNNSSNKRYLASSNSHAILRRHFLPVTLDWAVDAELCEPYHNRLVDRVHTSLGKANADPRGTNLLSMPEAPSCFDIIALPDGRPVFSIGRHLSDAETTAATAAAAGQQTSEQNEEDTISIHKPSSADDFDDDFSIPQMSLRDVLTIYSRRWESQRGAAHLRHQGGEAQIVQARVHHKPRLHVTAQYARNVAQTAIQDFNFLVDGEEKEQGQQQNEPRKEDNKKQLWESVASSPGNLLNGIVPLFVDAQHGLRIAHRARRGEGGAVEQLDDAVLKAGRILSAASPSECSLDALAEGALMELLVMQEQIQQQIQQQNQQQYEEENQQQPAAATATWMPVLIDSFSQLQTLCAEEASNISNKKGTDDASATTVPRSEASSAALCKVVAALAANVATLPAATTEQRAADMRRSLRLAVWSVAALFERARAAKSSRTSAIDSVHAWAALVSLLRLVGYNRRVSGEVLDGCAEGLVEALRPLLHAWSVRADASVARERQQQLAPRTIIGGVLKKERAVHDTIFARRRVQLLQERDEAEAAARDASFHHSSHPQLQQQHHHRSSSPSSSSLSSKLTPLVDANDYDLDDVYAMFAASSAAASAAAGGGAASGGDAGAVSAVTDCATASSSSSSSLLADAQTQEEAWLSQVLSVAVGLPVEGRQHQFAPQQQNQQQGNKTQNAAGGGGSGAQKQQQDDVKDRTWAAANVIWAGAPRADRGAILANALRAVNSVHRILLLNAAAGSSSAYFASLDRLRSALRQVAAIVLSTRTQRRGDCLATHGNLIGAVLTAAERPTVAVHVAGASTSSSTDSALSSSSSSSSFSLLDFGAYTHRTLGAPVDVDATVEKFMIFFDETSSLSSPSSSYSFRESVLGSISCLSVISHVQPLSVDSLEEIFASSSSSSSSSSSVDNTADSASTSHAAAAAAGDVDVDEDQRVVQNQTSSFSTSNDKVSNNNNNASSVFLIHHGVVISGDDVASDIRGSVLKQYERK